MTTRAVRNCFVLLVLAYVSCGLFAVAAHAAGDCVSGNCEDGAGVMHWSSGHRYEGDFKNGHPNGEGAMSWPNGQKYVGGFRNGQMAGKGQLTWPDGQQLSSDEWKGLVTGQGVHTRPDGRKYAGALKDNRRAGQGAVTRPDGTEVRGYWADARQIDELTAAEFDTPSSPPQQMVAERSEQPAALDRQKLQQQAKAEQKRLEAEAKAQATLRKKQLAVEAERRKAAEEKARLEGIAAEQERQNAESSKVAEELKALTEERLRLESHQGGVASAELDARRVAEEKKRIEQIKREQEEKKLAQTRVKEELAKLAAERAQLEEEQRRLAALEQEQRKLIEEKERLARQKAQVAEMRAKLEKTGQAKLGGETGQPKTALIIGNSAYLGVKPLANPGNDAEDMAAVLQKLGFDTTLMKNASKVQIEKAITDFGHKLKAGGMGLFFFAGHGVQVAGENYLVPTDAVISSEADVAFGCVKASRILSTMEDAKNDLNIIILDACRNNPFARGFSRTADRGLAKMDAPMGALLAYATAPGKIASDGGGRNGLYTKHLLTNIAVPGLSAEEMFKRVRQGVASESEKKQVPWEASSLIGNFTFVD